MSSPAIEVKDLVKKFGDFTAVNQINFQVEQGEIFGFLGPNGAGKTTTIRMLCGLMDPTSGGGKVAGLDISSQGNQIKEIIGYMSQKFSLYDDLTVEENIDFFGGMYQVPKDKLAQKKSALLAGSELKGREKELTVNLAASLKQHVAFTCAQLHDPKIIFLDEPTAGVDPLSRRKFWRQIRLLAQSKVTILVTTHYMDEAEYCDRLILMHNAKIVGHGSPRQLKQSTGLSSLEDVFVSLIERQEQPK